MDCIIRFTDEEWARIVPAMLANGVIADSQTVATWLRTTMRNVVHRYERNKAYDDMQTVEVSRQEADRW